MIIIQDTREQYPWDFSFYEVDTVVRKLDTGDYSLEGEENNICIERKRSTGELSQNLGSKRATFERELERMTFIRDRYLILEFSIQDLLDFPKNSGIPKKTLPYIRMNAQYMIKLLDQYQDKYGIEIIYANNRDNAQSLVMDIFNGL